MPILKFSLPFFLFFHINNLQAQDSAYTAGLRSDLDFLNTELSTKHKNAFTRISKSGFDSLTNAIKEKAGSLNNAGFIIELFRIMAAVGDERSSAQPILTTYFPLRFDYFDEGPAVISADTLYKDCLGGRLIAIDRHPVKNILEAFAGIFKKDNASFIKFWTSTYLNRPMMLKGLGMISSAETASFTFLTPEGKEMTREVKAVGFSDKVKRVISPALALLLPYSRDFNYWYQADTTEHYIYFNYMRCAEDKNISFKVFTDQLFSDAEKYKTERLIIDLRFNGGGNSAIFQPFLNRLKTSPLNAKGKLFVIIGRQTFSSALMNAIDLIKNTNAITVGESTGANINHFGEVKSFMLPYSKINITYSTKRWINWEGHEGALKPDVMLPHTLKNFLGVRDEVLEYILK